MFTPNLLIRKSARAAFINVKRAMHVLRRVSLPLLAGFATIALVAIVLALPRYIVEGRRLPLTAKEKMDAESDIRTSLLQMMGGTILVAGLYFTAQGFRLTREGHITARYSTAIDQLGSSNLDVRVGGIYALERIARDSIPDREVIIEVMTTFIREHTRSVPRTPSEERIGADVQAALSVLARRPLESRAGLRPLDLYQSGLSGADFQSGYFKSVSLYYSRLDNAIFTGAMIDLAGLSFCKARGAAFNYCSARGANFVHAQYDDGWFIGTDLTGADFFGCDLSGSDLGRRDAEKGHPAAPAALLHGARLTNAVLTGTNLRGVDLTTVRGLTRDQLEKAVTDKYTKLPASWGPADEPLPSSA
jgi:hypothetical protein